MNKQLTYSIQNKDMIFHMTIEKYNHFINEVSLDNQICAAKNYLLMCIDPKQKADLIKLLDSPGFVSSMTGQINKNYAPSLEIMLIKSTGDGFSKQLVYSVENKEFIFNMTVEKYNNFISEMTLDNKIICAKNYLLACVDENQKTQLLKMFNIPSFVSSMTGQINKDYTPNIEVVLKKSQDVS